MTQAQLNSTAKRINTALVQFGKTFGIDSPAYTRYKNQIIEAVGSKRVHETKSGHIAINLGKGLFNIEEKLKELDRPTNKVKGRMKEAENLLKGFIKETNPEIPESKIKITKTQISEMVNRISGIENFFDDEVAEYYVIEKQAPDIKEILDDLREKRGYKLSYTELLQKIDKLKELMDEYNKNSGPTVLSKEEVEEKRKNKNGLRIKK